MARKKQENFAEAIRRRFARYGGVELELPERDPPREPPDFGYVRTERLKGAARKHSISKKRRAKENQ